jgi:hypothetical protein
MRKRCPKCNEKMAWHTPSHNMQHVGMHGAMHRGHPLIQLIGAAVAIFAMAKDAIQKTGRWQCHHCKHSEP